jgi:hypothetical protein
MWYFAGYVRKQDKRLLLTNLGANKLHVESDQEVFALINLGFLFTAVVVVLCVVSIARKYAQQRSPLQLVFIVFLMALGSIAGIYAIRGLYESGNPMDILLWLGTNVLYPAVPIPLAIFLTLPFLRQSKGKVARTLLMTGVVSFIVIAIFNLTMIATSQVIPTFVDPWTLPHYKLENSLVPYAYYITLALDVAIALYAAVLLGVTAHRESDVFYKRKTQLIMCGWLVILFTQLLLLVPALTILNPPFEVLGSVMVALGVLRTKPT